MQIRHHDIHKQAMPTLFTYLWHYLLEEQVLEFLELSYICLVLVSSLKLVVCSLDLRKVML